MTTVRRKRKKTAKEIAEKLGVTERTVRSYIAEDRDSYESNAAKRRLVAGTMHAQGASWSEIAKAVGGSENAARALVRRYKLAKAGQ